MLTVGIDIGSPAVKAALWDGADFQTFLFPTGWNPQESSREAFEALLQKAGAKREDITQIISTGYGRKMCAIAHKKVTEITCHAAGAAKMTHGARTLLDIGGQDSKVILMEADGKVKDFLMNDKCAAGTGRFLQNMAVLLEYSLEDFAEISRDTEPQPITNMCTVFAETEVISLLARGVPKSSIALGLLEAAASRAAAMVGRLSSEGALAFTGGAALNPLLAELIAKHSGREVLIPPQPQFAGAFGAALIAAQKNQ